MKADLKRFGKIEDGILTCGLHGWRYELATGRCLTAEGYRLYTQDHQGKHNYKWTRQVAGFSRR